MDRRRLARHALLAVGAVKLAAAGRTDLARAALLLPRSPEERRWSSAIEATLRTMQGSTEVLRETDGQTLGDVARATPKQIPWSWFLYRIVRTTRPRSVVEMGTAVGISGAYIAAALKDLGGGRLLTLEGSEARADVARSNLAKLELSEHVDVRVGWFEDTLAAALADAAPIDVLFIDGDHHEEPTVRYFRQAIPHLAPSALVLFDDIRWNDGMRRAWRTISAMPEVKLAVDLRSIGIVAV